MSFRKLLAALLLFVACGGEPRTVSFGTSDGGVVGALVYGEGPRALVLVHGGRFDKESWSAQAPLLAKAGFRVLAIDLRGRGISHGGSQPDAAEQIHLDVLAAVDHARARGATSVAVIGASLGGWAAAQAAVEAPPGTIDRLVLLAAPGIEHPERMQGRKLFVTARDDVSGSGQPRLRSIRAQYERTPGPKELVVLDGNAHAQFLFQSEQSDELMRRMLEFLTAP
jgi:alpha/beta superfamily hydrolase